MSAVYESPKYSDGEEHLYCEPLPVNSSGNTEPQPVTSTVDGAAKGGNSGKTFRLIALVLGINNVFILALAGISAYLLMIPRPNGSPVSEPTVSGSWSQWGQWSTCSLTCGSGVTIRFRRCDGPAPSSNGKDCIGDPMEADSCKLVPCQDCPSGPFRVTVARYDEDLDLVRAVKPHIERLVNLKERYNTNIVIAFAVYLRERKIYNWGDTIVFDNVMTNIGSHYSLDTGNFTAPIAGVYVFSWNTQSTTNLLTCLSHNGECKIHAFAYGEAAKDPNIFGDGNSAILELKKGDRVWIEVVFGEILFSNNAKKWFYPIFTGYILH